MTSRSSGGSRAERETGFTLVELLVVLAIAGLLMALLPPLFSGGYARAQFRHEARAIAASLRETRSLAIARGRGEAFFVAVDRGQFAVGAKGRPHRLPDGMRMILVTTTRDVLDATAGEIRFFPDGSSSGGGVRLIQGEREYDILVDWFTGRVSATEVARDSGVGCQRLHAC